MGYSSRWDQPPPEKQSSSRNERSPSPASQRYPRDGDSYYRRSSRHSDSASRSYTSRRHADTTAGGPDEVDRELERLDVKRGRRDPSADSDHRSRHDEKHSTKRKRSASPRRNGSEYSRRRSRTASPGPSRGKRHATSSADRDEYSRDKDYEGSSTRDRKSSKRRSRDKDDDEDEEDRERRRRRKERERSKDKEERRSVLTGKKIKLKVKKEKGDDEREANRRDLLQFLNSM
ncbi:hypothetical protein DFH09DRAFT_1160762 [Mycena vulgaris]|nr:hypothetical protein DFH09DRAFT_1160762 [Mycena vulgaris]